MWFIAALLTAIAWGAANLFYKKGSQPTDRFSHLKIVTMVGFVMGIHAFIYLFIIDFNYNPIDMLRYLPVSALYIVSMTIGYIGLRYIELSIAAPVQNSAGAVSAILLFIFFPREMHILDVSAVIIITAGVIGLAIIEKQIEDRIRQLEGYKVDPKYQISIMAITFPILYAIIDGVGTFVDGIYLDELKLISEDAALISYELTFFLVALSSYIYVRFIKKQPFFILKERDRTYAAILETTGQFFYVFALAGNAIIAAPLIAHTEFSPSSCRAFS